jgi:hypothetical protein
MDAHHREAAAAEAAIADFYGTRYRPKPGDRVMCPKAFGGGYQPGVIACPEGDAYLVDTAEGRLLMYLEELEPVVEPCRSAEPLTTPAKPGSHNATAARRAGCEDAYDNAMEARYGEGW